MKTSISIFLALVASSPAFAADLPSRAAPPVYVPPIVPATWTGCYAGGFGAVDIAHVGNDPSEARSNTFRTTGTTVTPFRRTSPGFFGGATHVDFGNVHTTTTTVTNASERNNLPYGRTFVGGDGGGRVGCNYQTGRFVLGGQLEGGYLGINGTSTDPVRPTTSSSIGGGAYGAVTGRIGYAVFDRTLLFIRGGAGYADLKFSTSNPVYGFNVSARGSQVMPVVGAGIEYKLTPNVSVTGEYTYMRPGCKTLGYNVALGAGGGGTSTSCVEKQMITLGLNYYFTPVAAPVVARY